MMVFLLYGLVIGQTVAMRYELLLDLKEFMTQLLHTPGDQRLAGSAVPAHCAVVAAGRGAPGQYEARSAGASGHPDAAGLWQRVPLGPPRAGVRPGAGVRFDVLIQLVTTRSGPHFELVKDRQTEDLGQDTFAFSGSAGGEFIGAPCRMNTELIKCVSCNSATAGRFWLLCRGYCCR